MSSEGNKAVVRQFLDEVFGGGNLELVDEIFAPDYVLHDPAVPGAVGGTEGMKQYVSMYRAAYPDTHFTIEDQIAEGDHVVTRWTGQGTHRGELLGIAPTGKLVTVTGIEVDRVSGGRIEETWVNYDALGMMQQLGVIPAPEQAEA
ncbi:MAG TPA: ester cyclase [Rubrobacter sp.]|nr:ester cyclase [Rubrobacter sp.]